MPRALVKPGKGIKRGRWLKVAGRAGVETLSAVLEVACNAALAKTA